MDETIYSESEVGKRLDKIRKKEARCLVFKGRKIPLVVRITIGRDKNNLLVIDDKMTSRFHSVIQKIKSVYYVKDLDSRNGTFVNGVRVPKGKYVKLNPTDVLCIGRTEIAIT